MVGNLTESGNLTLSGGGDLLSFEPSLPACIGLSALGGLLEVTSTMCLAFPEYKSKLGRPYRKCTQRVLLAANLALMGLASVLYIVGSWFGPVSISVPTVMVSKLLSNLVIMGVVLRMADFPKPQQVPAPLVHRDCTPLRIEQATWPEYLLPDSYRAGGHLLHRVRHPHAA